MFVSYKLLTSTTDVLCTILFLDNHVEKARKTLTNDYLPIHCSQFRLSYYPHRKDAFTKLLKSVFGEKAKHSLYGDFRPLADVQDPAFFIHVIEK